MNKKNARFIIGASITAILIAMAIVSIFYTPYDPETINIKEKFLSPCMAHIMGTDNFGRDIFSRVMVGLKDTIIISGLTIAIGFATGLIAGCFTGYFGGAVDEILMRINDALSSIPSVLLAIVMIGTFGSGTTTLIISLGIVFIPSFARMIRSDFIKEKNREYVMCAKLSGAGAMRIIFVHILPNCKNTIISSLIVGFNNAILAEASLSFLGIGVAPPKASLGAMLKESQMYLSGAPWYSIFPGITIVLLIIGLVLLGEGLKKK
ncbi:MAG: ABC transporter permease [Lachnospiraceae bacterium]|nr:ABC transporter permease [Lachnospiraceae bacterium]